MDIIPSFVAFIVVFSAATGAVFTARAKAGSTAALAVLATLVLVGMVMLATRAPAAP